MVGPKLNMRLNYFKILLLETNMNYRFAYLREKSIVSPLGQELKGFPVACIAMVIDRNEHKVKYGLITIHPTDKISFSKEHGRSMAVERLHTQGKEVNIPKGDYSNIHDVIRLIVSDIADNEGTPSRTKRAAKRWIKNSEEFQ